MLYEMSPESLIISDTGRYKASDDTVIPEDEQITLTWKNISVTTETPKRTKGLLNGDIEMREVKTILTKVTGLAEPGHFLAIMGSSGAGKTTLLNVLTGRSARQLHLDGTILANGKPITENFRKVSAYVQQHGLFLGTLTVKEHLMFQATLRMDRHLSKKQRIERVDKIIEQVGLSKCVNTMIGLPGQRSLSLSGGEERRLSLASELLTRPPVLFCDEPTSGLDSYMAASVVKTLKDLAASGHTIVCTIHQPSSDVCAIFDKILLMAVGRCAYIGTMNTALRFFKDIGYVCPSTYCPTDYLLGVLAIKPGREDYTKVEVNKICDAFENSPDSLAVEVKIAKTALANNGYKVKDDSGGKLFKTSWLTQLCELYKRCFRHIWRNPLLLKVNFFTYVVTSLLFGVVYTRQDKNQRGVQNIQGCLFQVAILVGVTNFMKSSKIFPEEWPLFVREYGDRAYSVSAYFLSRSTVEIPIKLSFLLIEITVVFWMVGFGDTIESYLQMCGIMALLLLSAHFAGLCFGSMCPTVPLALLVANLWMLPCLTVGGYYMNVSTVPVYLLGLYYVSYLPFAYESASIIIWKDVDHIGCIMDDRTRCLETGSQVLGSYGFDEAHFYTNVGILLVSIIGYATVAFLILWMKARRSR